MFRAEFPFKTLKPQKFWRFVPGAGGTYPSPARPLLAPQAIFWYYITHSKGKVVNHAFLNVS